MSEHFYGKLENLILFITIILGTIFIANMSSRFFARFLNKNTGIMQADPTSYQFLRHAMTGIIYLVGIAWALLTLPGFKSVAGSMLTGAGILAVVVGFASQHAMSNIISGIFIIVFKPFRVNDRLKIRDNIVGIVEDITLRHVVLRDLENKRIIIPNSVISNEIVINSDFVDEKLTRYVDLNISFDSDIAKAKQIMYEEVFAHPLHLDPRTPEQIEEAVPEVIVRVISINEFSVTLRAWAWAKDAPDAFVLGCDLLESIKKRFDNEGIKIPVARREISQI